MSSFRREFLVCLAALLAMSSSHAQTVGRIVTGFPPGGAVDIIARLYADELSRELGKTFIVDTRPGGGGLVATELAKAAVPDGSTVLLGTDSNMIIYPHTVSKPTYETLRDFVPVGLAGSYEMAFAVKKDARLRDFKSFITAARTDGKLAAFGSPGPGSLPHFYGALLGDLNGIPMTHIAYRGVGPA